MNRQQKETIGFLLIVTIAFAYFAGLSFVVTKSMSLPAKIFVIGLWNSGVSICSALLYHAFTEIKVNE